MRAHNILLIPLCAFLIILSSCSDTPSQPGNGTDGTVIMSTEMTSSHISGTTGKVTGIQAKGEIADSLFITRIRILIKEMKLQREDDESEKGERMLKIGPTLVTTSITGANVVLSEPIPAGSYEKVKFEFHRFSNDEISLYLNDPLYSDFVTNERSTFIIDGIVYNNGVGTNFTYHSDATANLMLNLEPPVTVSANVATQIALLFDMPLIFRIDRSVLDPRDPRNANDIDNAIKRSIRALKRF